MDQTSSVALVSTFASHPLLYKSQPCMTFEMIDAAHERPDGTAKMSFFRNRDKFTEGKHFFEVPFAEWSKLESISKIPSSSNDAEQQKGSHGGYRGSRPLFTERGYLMIVKPFDDDLAWFVQELLVDEYFRLKQEATQSGLVPASQVITTNGIPEQIMRAILGHQIFEHPIISVLESERLWDRYRQEVEDCGVVLLDGYRGRREHYPHGPDTVIFIEPGRARKYALSDQKWSVRDLEELLPRLPGCIRKQATVVKKRVYGLTFPAKHWLERQEMALLPPPRISPPQLH